MKITVIGMGHAGTTIAADLSIKGHVVTILKTSDDIHNEHHQYLLANKVVTLKENGKTKAVKIYNATEYYEEAVCSADVIIIFVQTNYHRKIIDNIKPFIRDGQIILLEPGYLSTAFFLPLQKDISIVEAESSPIDCRIVSPGTVKVLFRNVKNPIGVFPSKNKWNVKNILNELYNNFIFTESVIEAALHNPNLIVHTIGAIMSIPRIEYTNGEYWMYKEVFTPSVWNIVEELDLEKMAILSKLGFLCLPYVEACKERNSTDDKRNAIEVFFDYAKHHSPKGPNCVVTRYITEDVPEGLVLLESLGNMLSVPTRVCTALIDIASVSLKMNFRESGRTITKLGKKNIEEIINDRQ